MGETLAELNLDPRLTPQHFENYRQKEINGDIQPLGMVEVTKESLWEAYQNASQGGRDVAVQVLHAATKDQPQPNWFDVSTQLKQWFRKAIEEITSKPQPKPLPSVVARDELPDNYDRTKLVPAYRGKRKDGEAIDFLKQFWGPWLDGVSLSKKTLRTLEDKLIARLEWWQSQPGNELPDGLFAPSEREGSRSTLGVSLETISAREYKRRKKQEARKSPQSRLPV